jgi:hypothetical protein
MRIYQHCATALTLLALSVTSAVAAPLSLQASSIPSYLNNGAYQGSFDATGLLPARYAITNMQFSFVFIDDGDIVNYTTGPSATSTPLTLRQKVDAKTSTETIDRTVTSTRYGLGERESVKLSFDSLSWFGETAAVYESVIVPTAVSSPTQVLYAKSADGSSCSFTQWKNGSAGCQQTTRTTVTHYQTSIVSTDYTGQIALNGSLMGNEALKTGLMKNGKVDFRIDALGDIDLASATLDIDFEVLQDTDLPEPASGALFGIALAGLAGARRKPRA